MKNREEEFKALFENNSVSCWLKDYSEIQKFFEGIGTQGVLDIDAHFDEHPGLLYELFQAIKIKDINQATLELHKAETKKELLQDLDKIFTPESIIAFGKELIDLWDGRTHSSNDCIVKTIDGDLLYVQTNLKVLPGHKDTLSSVLLSIVDNTSQRLVEQKLLESEKKFKSLFNKAQVALFRTGIIDGQVFEINERYAKMAGYPNVEECMADFNAADAWVNQSEREKMLETLIDKGSIFDCETQIYQRNKNIIWISFSATIYPELGYIEGSIVNITQNKQAEIALLRSKKQYQNLIERLPDIVYKTNMEGEIIYVSPSIEKITGYAPEEVLGLKIADEFYRRPEDREMLLTLLQKKEFVNNFEALLKRKDGSSWWASTNAHFSLDKDGKVIGVEGIARDVTERKKHENRLNTLTNAIDFSYNGFCIVDSKGLLIYVNKAFLEMYGYNSVEEMIGTSFVDICVDPHLFQNVIHELRKNGEYEFEHEGKKEDDSIFNVKMYVTVASDEEGNEIYPASNVDITNQKITENQLNEYREHLERLVEERNKELLQAQKLLLQREKLAAIGQLSGSVAHDIRNPLGIINNAIYFLKHKHKNISVDQLEKYILTMENAVERANDIITDLMDFSKKNKPNLVKTSINSSIRSLLKDLKVPKEITVQQTLDPTLPNFPFDPVQIQRVLHNLVSNAVQAMPEGGNLKISTELTGNFVELKITDTGAGITHEEMNNIYEPLFTTKSKGVGLGLSIAKTFVDVHKGIIKVNSEVGKGTTFVVLLPL